MNDSGIVTLMTFDTLGEAEVTKALLDAAGVNNALVNDVLSSVLPLDSFARIAIEVAEEDLPMAQKVITAGFDKAEFEAEVKASRKEK